MNQNKTDLLISGLNVPENKKKCIKVIAIDKTNIYCFDNEKGISHFSYIKPSDFYTFTYSFKNENDCFISVDNCLIKTNEVYHRHVEIDCINKCDCVIYNNKALYFIEFYHNGKENSLNTTRYKKINDSLKQIEHTFYFFDDSLKLNTSSRIFNYWEEVFGVISMNYYPSNVTGADELTNELESQIVAFNEKTYGLTIQFKNEL